EALRDTMGIRVEMKEIGQQAIAFREWCNKAVAEEAAMQSYIQRLERHYDEAVQILGKPSEYLPESPSEDMPNPQELVADLEDFLRRQSKGQ
ncbi:MAG: hypothetical protein HY685_04625, partial [Chloroflexi bacterium]|nr:hypothetical protein [Chloroflexota bacterium]